MAEIVNLRQARKRKRREAKHTEAAASRARHGRTGAEKQASGLGRTLAERRHAAHKRESPDETDPGAG